MATVTDDPDELEPAIVAALKASVELEAICGDRVYPSRIPEQSILPALSYQISRIDRVMSLRGAAGLRRVTVDFECRSVVKSENRDTREVIRYLFQGYIGMLGPVRIKYISLDDESDDYDQPTPGSDDGTYSKTFSCTYVLRESIPGFGPEPVPTRAGHILIRKEAQPTLLAIKDL